MAGTGPDSNDGPAEAIEEDILFSCGAHHLHEQGLATDSPHKNARANISVVLDQSGPWTNRITGHIRIPVVFHVVWHT